MSTSNDAEHESGEGPARVTPADYAALSRRLGRLYQTLSRTNAAIARSDSETALLEELCRIAVDAGGFALAWVGLVGPDGHLRASAAAGVARGYADDIDVSMDERDGTGGGPTARVLRSGEPVICNDFLADPRTLAWHGRAREFGIRASAALPIRADGRVVGVLNVYSDTTGDFGPHEVALLDDLAADISLGIARLRAARDLGQAAEQGERLALQLKRIEEAVRAGVFRIALPERAVSWSAGVAALLGHDAAAPADWAALERALTAAGAAALVKAIRAAGAGDGTLDLDLPLAGRVGGANTWLRVSARVQPQGGERLEAQGTIQDVTARKRAEERKERAESQSRQAQKMQALGVLAGGLASEFSTAFAIIDGHINMARKDARRNAKVLQSLAVCSRACRNAAEFARQILAFSRGQSAGRRVASLPRVVEDAAALLRTSLPPGDEVEFRTSAEVPAVYVDEAQIQQVVVTLGIRAGQAFAGRGATLRITVDAVRADAGSGRAPAGLAAGPCARVVIAAAGEGPAERGVLAEAGAEAAGDGAGPAAGAAADAGLEVAEEIARAHGGALAAERGPGAPVTLYLPAASVEQQAQTPESARSRNKTERRTQPAGTGQRILIVDDHKWLLVLVERLLTERGYQPRGYLSAAAALEALHADPDGFDLVVTDYKMPGSTGFDVIRAVRAIRPDLPVVLVSGYVSDKVTEQARRAGADAVLAKLALGTELLPTLSRLLAREPVPPATGPAA